MTSSLRTYLTGRRASRTLQVPNHPERPEIEHGIPLPVEARGGLRKYDHFYPLEDMKPGGLVLGAFQHPMHRWRDFQICKEDRLEIHKPRPNARRQGQRAGCQAKAESAERGFGNGGSSDWARSAHASGTHV